MSGQELAPETVKAVQLIEKLLNLAAKNTNEAEAAAAAAKAQELLTLHNLDLATVERGSGDSGKREDSKLRGGVYLYQRKLWRGIAELNFCMYFTTASRIAKTLTKTNPDGSPVFSTRKVRTHQHRLIGRTVNVRVTRHMAEYVEQAIERKCRERLGGDHRQLFSRWATSYRDGAADRVMEKVYARRREMLAEEKRKQKEEEERLRASGRDGVSTATALTIQDVKEAERDANMDILMGETGYSARVRAERARAAQLEKEAEEAYTKWAAENPEEARKKEAEQRKADEAYWKKRRGGRQSYGRAEKPRDDSAYYAGYDAGGDIGLEPQVREPNAGRIGRR